MFVGGMTSTSTSTTSGTLAHDTHSIIQGGLIPGGRSLKRDRQLVFFTAVNPMYASQDLEEDQYDLDKPRIAVYKNTWRIHQNTVYWCNLKLAQRKGLQFYQTRSHAFALFQHTTFDLYWESGIHEDWRGFTLQSTSITKVTARRTYAKFAIWTSGSSQSRSKKIHRPTKQTKRQVQGNLSLTSRGHTSQASRRKSAMEVQGNLSRWCWLGILHSTVQREDSNRNETVKRLTQQIEDHPNRDSLIQDLDKTEEFNPFSEKSKELITSIGNTEYFELCETSSMIQCLDCALCCEAGIIYCTCGKCMQPTERNRQLNKARYDVLSIPGYVTKKKKNMVPDMDHLCGRPCTTKHMICWGKPVNTKVVVTKPLWKDGTMMAVSLCQISGGLRNRSFNMAQLHWKIIPTWLHGKK